MKDSVRRYWLEFNNPLEGRVQYMYCDRLGYVSTGVGIKIDQTSAPMTAPTPAQRASSLDLANQFQWTAPDNSVATAEMVAADWDSVKSRMDLSAQGHLAYLDKRNLVLSQDEIDRAVFAKVDAMEATLKGGYFTDFDDWPADAQLGLLSMSWGIGPARFGEYPTFRGYVAAGDWAGASGECRMLPNEGTIIIRNKRNAQCFQNAGRVVGEGLDPELLSVDLTSPLGIQVALAHLGCDPGPTDGGIGPKTTAAVQLYQSQWQMDQTGNPADIIAQLNTDLVNDGFNVFTS